MTPVPVEVGQLIDLLQGGEYRIGGRLHVRTGEVLPEIGYTDLIASGLSTTKRKMKTRRQTMTRSGFLSTHSERESLSRMQRFIATHVPPPIAERPSDAVSGKGRSLVSVRRSRGGLSWKTTGIPTAKNDGEGAPAVAR